MSGASDDAIAGALLLSAYGDALGLAHEAAGLRGEVGDPDGVRLGIVDHFRDPNPNPWNIWAPAELTAGVLGVVSDDTATKIALVEPWLASLRPDADSFAEDNFIDWLRHRRPADPVPWREAVAAEQARQWLHMYDQADGTAPPCGEGGASPSGSDGSGGDASSVGDDGDESPCFYRPGQPAMFGPFLYGGAALAFAGQPVGVVFDTFADLCRLDQAEGRGVSGVFACLVAAAADREIGEAGEVGLDTWLDRALDEAFTAWADADVPHLSEVENRCRWSLDELGRSSRDLDGRGFLYRMKSDLYDHPARAPQHDLKPFDPLLQLSQVLAILGYAGDDRPLAFRLAATSPGDSDTIAAHLGLILGAHIGTAAARSGRLSDALSTVERTTDSLFERETSSRVAAIRSLRAAISRPA
ncbi:MAG: hypothetical protein AAF333_08670 [Planctomycetota bacterium]